MPGSEQGAPGLIKKNALFPAFIADKPTIKPLLDHIRLPIRSAMSLSELKTTRG